MWRSAAKSLIINIVVLAIFMVLSTAASAALGRDHAALMRLVDDLLFGSLFVAVAIVNWRWISWRWLTDPDASAAGHGEDTLATSSNGPVVAPSTVRPWFLAAALGVLAFPLLFAVVASMTRSPLVALIGLPLGIFASVTTYALVVRFRPGNQGAYLGCAVVLVLLANVYWAAFDQVLLQHLSDRPSYQGLTVSRALLTIPCAVVLLRLLVVQFHRRQP